MPVTDPGVAPLGHPERIAGLVGDEGIEVVFDLEAIVRESTNW